jgi:hypothetical protein
VLTSKNLGEKISITQIPDNHLIEIDKNCEIKVEKLIKKIKIERSPKATFEHIMQEEIYGSIDAVDYATDFNDKFISSHQVVLGGFEKAIQELRNIQDLII